VHRTAADAAAGRLLDALAPAADRAARLDGGVRAGGSVQDRWRNAAACVAAPPPTCWPPTATRMVPTAQPTAGLLDHPRMWAAGLGAPAHATEAVAEEATTLGLRALQAGVGPRRTRMPARHVGVTTSSGPRQADLGVLRWACGPCAWLAVRTARGSGGVAARGGSVVR
jgi:hypothetical protein